MFCVGTQGHSGHETTQQRPVLNSDLNLIMSLQIKFCIQLSPKLSDKMQSFQHLSVNFRVILNHRLKWECTSQLSLTIDWTSKKS